jgi:hypothetical protein
MRSIWQALIWKEWHEHKWKFASIVAILWCTAIVSLSQPEPDAFGLSVSISACCLIPLAMFVGLAAAANERSRGTFAFTQALPAPIWRISLVKLITGFLVLVASVVLLLPAFYTWGRLHESDAALNKTFNSAFTGSPYLDAFLICAPLAVSLYLWSAAAGVNRRDEVSAGAVALATILTWCLTLYVACVCVYYIWYKPTSLPASYVEQRMERIGAIVMSTAPAGFMPAFGVVSDDADFPHDLRVHYLIAIVAIASIVHLALASWYVWRFGRVFKLGINSPRTAAANATRPDWLGPPRRSPFMAIAWKQTREISPLVLATVATAIGIAFVVFISNWHDFLTRREELAYMASVIVVGAGYVAAMIVGIGICFYDVTPNLNTFWRSRPINSDLWFWIKYATGLIILVTILYVPLVSIVALVHPRPSDLLLTESALSICMAHLALFAAAAAMTSLTRHAVYGAILSIAALYAGIVVCWFVLKVAGVLGLVPSPPSVMLQMSSAQMAFGFLLTFVASSGLAWFATRNDWGKKSRY